MYIMKNNSPSMHVYDQNEIETEYQLPRIIITHGHRHHPVSRIQICQTIIVSQRTRYTYSASAKDSPQYRTSRSLAAQSHCCLLTTSTSFSHDTVAFMPACLFHGYCFVVVTSSSSSLMIVVVVVVRRRSLGTWSSSFPASSFPSQAATS